MPKTWETVESIKEHTCTQSHRLIVTFKFNPKNTSSVSRQSEFRWWRFSLCISWNQIFNIPNAIRIREVEIYCIRAIRLHNYAASVSTLFGLLLVS